MLTCLGCEGAASWLLACLLWLGVITAVLVGISRLFPTPRQRFSDSTGFGAGAVDATSQPELGVDDEHDASPDPQGWDRTR
jgi:hypothetical protein